MPRRVLEGKVVSDKMDKTVTVLVTRRFMHPLYKKFVRKTKKYAAHDDSNTVKVGDIVQIEECKPISKRKSWKVITASETRAAFQEDKKAGGSRTGAKTKTAKKKTATKDKAKKKSEKKESAKTSKAKKTKKTSKTKAEKTPKSEKKDTKKKTSKKKTTKKKSTSKKKDDK